MNRPYSVSRIMARIPTRTAFGRVGQASIKRTNSGCFLILSDKLGDTTSTLPSLTSASVLFTFSAERFSRPVHSTALAPHRDVISSRPSGFISLRPQYLCQPDRTTFFGALSIPESVPLSGWDRSFLGKHGVNAPGSRLLPSDTPLIPISGVDT